MEDFKSTPLNHAVCAWCQQMHRELYKSTPLSDLIISPSNFAFLDTKIGWACHPMYEDETKQFITNPQ
jgi:hypothetical protein